MTIATFYAAEDFTPTGSPFNFNFEFLELDDIVVVAVLTTGDRIVMPTNDYTVTGNSKLERKFQGGEVVLIGTLPSGTSVVSIGRATDIDQLIDYETYGPFPAETTEFTIDKLTMIDQEHGETLDYLLGDPFGGGTGPTGDYIPLAGTEVGDPVTGLILFANPTANTEFFMGLSSGVQGLSDGLIISASGASRSDSKLYFTTGTLASITAIDEFGTLIVNRVEIAGELPSVIDNDVVKLTVRGAAVVSAAGLNNASIFISEDNGFSYHYHYLADGTTSGPSYNIGSSFTYTDGFQLPYTLSVDTVNKSVDISGEVTMNNNRILDIALLPTTDGEAASKKYVDDNAGGAGNFVTLDTVQTVTGIKDFANGTNFSGSGLTNTINRVAEDDGASLTYHLLSDRTSLGGHVEIGTEFLFSDGLGNPSIMHLNTLVDTIELGGEVIMNSHPITGLPLVPTVASEAASKSYVDAEIVAAVGPAKLAFGIVDQTGSLNPGSVGITSVSKTGTGAYTINFTTAAASSTAQAVTFAVFSGGPVTQTVVPASTTSVNVQFVTSDTNVHVDPANFNVIRAYT
jgi:hypothetical protein